MGMPAESQFHVLAVDDCLLYRKVIEKLLKKSSFRVTIVDSGAKALEFLDNNDPNSTTSSENHQEMEVNLILTDYCMPGMTGYDLLKKIKETPSLRHIPVVIMSSENVPSRITECLEEGAEEFLLKPVREADLNRLKALMMRTKLKNQVEKSEIKEDDSVKPEILSRQEQGEQQQEEEDQQEQEQQQQEEEQQEEEEEEQQPISNNKRKVLEEGLTQDRTRPRYDEITTVV